MKKVTVILVTLMVLFGSALYAHGGEMGFFKGNGEGHGRMFDGSRGGDCDNIMGLSEDLKLTDDQKEAIEKVVTESRKNAIDLRADLEKLKIDKREAMRNDNYDKARSVTAKIYKIKAQLAEQRITTKENVNGKLTKEQRAKMKELRRKFVGKRGKGHKRNFWKKGKMRGKGCK